jgi:hypothetical protein
MYHTEFIFFHWDSPNHVCVLQIILFSCVPLEQPINLTAPPSYPFSLCPVVTRVRRAGPKLFCQFAFSINFTAANGEFSGLNWTPLLPPIFGLSYRLPHAFYHICTTLYLRILYVNNLHQSFCLYC